MGDAEVMIMSGSYEYTGGDGELYRTNWYADETGYHAEAEHLPRDERRHVICNVCFACSSLRTVT